MRSSAKPSGEADRSAPRSGVGGSNVGVAGSLGLDLIDSEALAQVAGGAKLVIVPVLHATKPADGDGSVYLGTASDPANHREKGTSSPWLNPPVAHLCLYRP
jgi:hypothetical protein